MGAAVIIMDDGRPSESTTLAYLLKEASKDDKALIKQYFLTVLSEGNVRIGNKVDDTQDLIMHQQDIPLGERFWLPDKSSKPCCGHISDICLTAFWDIFRHTPPPMTNYLFSPKVHYCTVFEEVCDPVHSVTTPQAAF